MGALSHGQGQLRAMSLSVQVSNRTRCNARCNFCISRTTPETPTGLYTSETIDIDRLHTGLRFAERLGATHMILTGKADPSQEDIGYLGRLIEHGKQYLPLVDIHTNGMLFVKRIYATNPLAYLKECGLTMLTISLAHHSRQTNAELTGITEEILPLISHAANNLGLLVRCSVVLAKSGIATSGDLIDYIYHVGHYGAHMVVVRELWNPDSYNKANPEVAKWNMDNFVSATEIIKEITDYADINVREPLPWGTEVFTMDGVWPDQEHSVNLTFANCGENNAPVLRSIVHKPNGHGYRNWDSNGDILY